MDLEHHNMKHHGISSFKPHNDEEKSVRDGNRQHKILLSIGDKFPAFKIYSPIPRFGALLREGGGGTHM